jgi:hypothetical protein
VVYGHRERENSTPEVLDHFVNSGSMNLERRPNSWSLQVPNHEEINKGRIERWSASRRSNQLARKLGLKRFDGCKHREICQKSSRIVGSRKVSEFGD